MSAYCPEGTGTCADAEAGPCVVGHPCALHDSLAIDVEKPCGRSTCRHPHDWTGGHCPGVRRRPTTRTPVAGLAATVRAQIGVRPC